MSHTPYVADRPRPRETSDELRARIPGWGADLDPADRPAVPRERYDPGASGARWTFPDRQEDAAGRERSIEHAMLTPVFGTTCPTKGLSGVVRRYAYRRFSEGRAAHWLLLIAADRVDVVESTLGSVLSGRPENPAVETGHRSELTGHPVRSRRGRSDWRHQVIDPVVVAGPWAAGALGAGLAGRAVVRRLRGR
jgi:hypothetical protein